ncbi:MAG TPA: outer membrane lipoprotein chaperone LolA [Burkholderiales bacterium]|nr:outer membrane lipoprotein chaperone LolA [Burkholderiales bacterium]
MRKFLLFSLFILFFQNAGAASLERFQSYLRTTRSGQADFEQKVFDKNGKLVQESRGSFSFLRPGRFRWIYAKPQQVIVGDGDRVWIHDADLNQVTVRRVSRVLGSTPAALLAGASDADQAFEMSELGEKDGLEWLEAKPREKDAGFERMRLGMSTSGVAAMELVDNFGQTTVLRFSNVVRNPPLEAGAFRFTPPKGADVLGE